MTWRSAGAARAGAGLLGFAGALVVALCGTGAAGLAGAVLLVVAWLAVDRLRPGARWLAVTGTVWALPLLVTPPLFSRDGYAYACQGQLLSHGMDPYRHGVADLPCTWLTHVPTLWWHTTTPYGPTWLGLSGTVATLSGTRLPLAIGLLRVVALAGVALLLVAGYHLARLLGTDPARGAWLAAGTPLVLLHGVAGVHNDALLAGLLLAALAVAARADRALWTAPAAGALLGLAAGVKITALVAAPFAVLLVARDRGWRPVTRAATWVGAGLVAAFAGASLATGLGLGWVGALFRTADLIQWTSPPTGVGMAAGYLARAAGDGGLARPALHVAQAAGLLALAVLLVALWLAARRHAERPGTVLALAGAALAGTALLSPVFFPWYALAPLAVLGFAPLPGRVRSGLAVAVAVLSVLVLPSGTGLAALTKPVGAFADLVLVSALVVVLIRRGRGRRATPRPPAS